MSSHCALILLAVSLLVPTRDAFAQEGQSQPPLTAEEMIAEQRADVRQIMRQDVEECEVDEWQPNTIVVCRKINETRDVMSVLPKPIDPGRMYVPGFEPPPCNGTCTKFGWVPEYPPLIDMTAFPEGLSLEEAAAIIEIPAGEETPTQNSARENAAEGSEALVRESEVQPQEVSDNPETPAVLSD